MGANRSKLLEDVKSNVQHKLSELSIDDLLEGKVLEKEFTNSTFKEYMKEELLEEEEEESTLVRYMETFKRDMLLNFTNSTVGKEIPNMSTVHVYDKFNEEYNNTYHNEFQTKVVQATNFLLSIFLKLAKTETQKEEVVNLLSTLEKELSNDQNAQQKFFSVFTLLNNLTKMITTEKNYTDFFKMLETYTNFLSKLLDDNIFTVYLSKDYVVDLAEALVTNVIQNVNLDAQVRKQGVIALLKIAVCFKVTDIYLSFIEQVLHEDCDIIKDDVTQFISEIYETKNYLDFSEYSSQPKSEEIKFNYNEKVGYSENSSYTTDGAFIYIHNPTEGLYKIGTGFKNTIQSKVYIHNKETISSQKGSLVYCCGKLYFRNPDTKPHPFTVINPADLRPFNETPSSFLESPETTHFFVDGDRSPANISYIIEGNVLLDPNRSDQQSKMVSDGRFIYIISKIGELRLIDNNWKGVFPHNTLFNVDVYDPVDDCKHITSFPIKDEKRILGDNAEHFVKDALSNFILCDGRFITFDIKSHTVTFNMVTRNITHCSEIPEGGPESQVMLDVYNGLYWCFYLKDSQENSTIKTEHFKLKLNAFTPNVSGSYKNFTSYHTFDLLSRVTSIFESDSKPSVMKEKEERVYDFFLKEKSKTAKRQKEVQKSFDKLQLVSIIINSLGDQAAFTLNQAEIDTKNIITHIFSKHALNFNTSTVEKLVSLHKEFMKALVKDNKVEYESKYHIVSGLLKIINGYLRQAVNLKFHKFKDFASDFAGLKEVVQDSIFIINEFYAEGEKSYMKGISTDLILQTLNIVDNYASIFDIEYPDFNLFMDILPKTNPLLNDFKKTALSCVTKNGSKVYSPSNIGLISELIQTLMKRNNNIINSIIDKFMEAAQSEDESALSKVTYHTEYEKHYESFFTPLLKLIFNTYLEIDNSKDEAEKTKNTEKFHSLFELFESLFRHLYENFVTLMKDIDSKVTNINFANVDRYVSLMNKIVDIISSSSYTYRFFYSSTVLINVFSKDNKIIFKTWHCFYDNLILFDKSQNTHNKIYKALFDKAKLQESEVDNKPISSPVDFVIDTPHPVTKNINIEKKFKFEDNPQDIFVEFDPLSYKNATCELKLTLITKEGEITEKFDDGLQNKQYKGVKNLTVSYETYSSNYYGLKMHIHNNVHLSHHFKQLQDLNTSFIINSIKSFFFFNHKKAGTNKDVEEMLQSKLFEGGIHEMLDLETSSEEYKVFRSHLRRSSSFGEFEKRLSENIDEFDENDLPPFEIDEFIFKENISVEKLIECFQMSLRRRFPWISIGGENADKIVRAAFSVVVKQEKLYEMITEVVNKILELEETSETKTVTIQELGEIENFEYLLLVWTEVSRLRQWYQEQIKDLAEANSENFDKQNEDFVNSVLQKCRFLFTLNVPKGKGKAKMKTKLNFLQIFAKNQIISGAKIENDIVKTNVIKFKKNLMQGKIEEGKSEIETVKKQIQSLTSCLKLTKVTIDSLRNAMRELNTRAKFREIALSLINSLLLEVHSTDLRLFVIKQIIQSLRKVSGKRLISIDDEIKSASPELLGKILTRFHSFIQIVFGYMLKSDRIFHISEYLDCLFWNLRARNQKVLIDVNLFENLYIQSPNEVIKSVWDKISKLKLSPFQKDPNSFKFNQKTLGFQLLEFFHIYSSMVAGRIIDETHNDSETQEQTGFFKKKSSVFDNSFDKLIENISMIISNKLKQFIDNYVDMNVNREKYISDFISAGEFENFPTAYFDESFLNIFLLLIYKFNINQSQLIMKHMKEPDFLVSLIVLIKYTSFNNIYSLINILKVYLTHLTDEDIHNVVYFLRKNELFKSQNYIGFDHADEQIDPRKLLVIYFLNSIYDLRRGFFSKDITLSSEYEVSSHIVNLVKFLYTEEKWRPTCDEIFIKHLKTMEVKQDTLDFKLASPILAVLNGDCEDLHYGSYVYLKYNTAGNTKSIPQRFREKVEEMNSCTNGYIIGFKETDGNIQDINQNSQLMKLFTENLRFNRESSNYAIIITLNKDTYEKSKVKNNEVEFQCKHVKDIILHPTLESKINNPQIIDILLNKENQIMEFFADPTHYQPLAVSYLQSQLLKSINSIFKPDNQLSQETSEYLFKNFSLDRLKPFISNLKAIPYMGLKQSQYELVNSIKLFLNSKTELKMDFADKVVEEKPKLSVMFLRLNRALRFYKEKLSSCKIYKILSSNCTIDSDSFEKIKTFKVVTLGDPALKNYLNTLIYCSAANEETAQRLNKIDDINFALIFAKKDLADVKTYITHPYVVLNADNEELENMLSSFNCDSFNASVHSSISNIFTIDMEKFKVKAEDVEKARTKPEPEAEEEDKTKIQYMDPVDVNVPEVLSGILTKINEPPKTLNTKKLDETFKRLIASYIRYFLVHIVSRNPSALITPDNYNFLAEQFKIVYYDACQTSLLTTFNYSKFVYINNLLTHLVAKEKEYGLKLISVDLQTKMFSSHSDMFKENFKKYVQSELVESYVESELESLPENAEKAKILDLVNKMLKLTTITINYETQTFSQYLYKSSELLKKYMERVTKSDSVEQLHADISLIKKGGLDTLVKYFIDSVEKEGSKLSTRSKILFSFIWEFTKLYSDTYRQVYGEERAYTFDDIPKNSNLIEAIGNVNILFYKSKDRGLRNQSLFSIEEIKRKLTEEIEIPTTPLIMTKTLNFKHTSQHKLRPDNAEFRGKAFVLAEKAPNGTFRINDMVTDDETNAIKVGPNDHLLVVNKAALTNELWMCGYNERHKLGNDTLSDCQYVYIPIQSSIDQNIRIKKVMNGYQSAMVLTYDNKIYIAGEGTNSGLDSLSKVFTSANKWNDILKKGEKCIDIGTNENVGAVMVTDKAVYVSGYNVYNIFGEVCGSSCYTSGIVKLSTPFRSNKVVELSLGYSHTLFRLDDGSVYGVGCNSCSELGLDNQNYITTVTKLPLNGLKSEKCSAGNHCSLFLMRERDNKVKLYSCGSYDYGQNGQGNSSDRRFKKCLGVEDLEWKFVKIGYTCSMGITTNNKLYTWGYNGYYNLSHSDTSYRYQPTLVEFFSDKTVLDGDITERNLAMRCLDSSGSIKVYMSGYNGYACMGVGDGISSYNSTPLEVTSLTGQYIQRVWISGTPYQVSFIKCNINSISNPYDFKCAICSTQNNSTLYLITKADTAPQNICEKCWTTTENSETNTVNSLNVALAIKNIGVGSHLDSMSLPDLTAVNEHSASLSKEKHLLNCYDCTKIISEERAYIAADELADKKVVAFCESCYSATSYFDVPRFVYCVKNAIDYLALLTPIDSYTQLKFNVNSKLKLSDFQSLNEDGLKLFYKDNVEVIDKINKQFEEVKVEHVTEYLKITDGEEKDKKVIMEEAKKISAMEKLSASQFDIIELLVNKLDACMRYIKDFIDMNFSNSIREIYKNNLQFLGKKTRNEMFEKALYEGANEVSPDSYYVTISRGKAVKFKQKNHVDYQGNYTIFGQVVKGIKDIPISQYLCKKGNRLFRVTLKGEGAIDVGGPYREIMDILCDELQSCWHDLLVPTPNNKFVCGQDREKWTINPSAKSATHLEMFRQLGKLFGFAIRSVGYLNLNLPSFVWKQILEQPLDISDLERIDIHTANFLGDLMNLEAKGIDEPQFEYIYDQQLTTILSNGKEVEVQSGGNDMKLTYANAKEYVKMALNTRFEECLVQIDAIKSGLYEVIKKELVLILHWKDLQEKVCGSLQVDVEWLKKNTQFEGWSSSDQVVEWFWQAMNKFTNEEKILYLKFVWGRSRLPLTADSFTQKHKIDRSYTDHPDISLPLSHTCFFTIDIPAYSSYDILYNKLLYAIKFCGEIDNDNNPSEALEDL